MLKLITGLAPDTVLYTIHMYDADNAYDPDVSASELWIDKVVMNGKPCLTLTDNGRGMDFEHLLKMFR